MCTTMDKIVLALVLLIGFGCVVKASKVHSTGRCVVYNDNLSDGSRGFCSGMVDTFYLPPNMTQEELERRAQEQLFKDVPEAEKLLLLLPESCIVELKTYTCSVAFAECNFIDPYFLQLPFAAAPGLTANRIPWFDAAHQKEKSIDDYCAEFDLVWNPNLATCARALPKLPCKSTCDELTSTEKTIVNNELRTKCPLISGTSNLFDLLVEQAFHSKDPVSRKRATNLLTEKSCLPNSIDQISTMKNRCRSQRFTVNILSVFGLAPDCIELEKIYEHERTMISKIASQVRRLGSGQCGHSGMKNTLDCGDIVDLASCSLLRKKDDLYLQDFYAYDSGRNSICHDITNSEVNQDNDANSFLARRVLMKAAMGEKCYYEQREKMKSSYFVPVLPGSPLFPTVKQSRKELESASCNDILATNFIEIQNVNVPSAINSKSYKNMSLSAFTLAELKLKQEFSRIPKWSTDACRESFRQMTCSRERMKFQLNSLCLLEHDKACDTQNLTRAAAEDRFALSFLLPRFPSKELCRRYRNECGNLILHEPMLHSLLDISCDEVIPTECSHGVKSTIWPCKNIYRGLRMFPETHQRFITRNELSNIGWISRMSFKTSESIVASFETEVVDYPREKITFSLPVTPTSVRNLQTCFCPDPLVAPEDPEAVTVSNISCCAIRCEGTMSSDEEIARYDKIVVVVNSIGLIAALFMVITWGLFKSKEKQKITFWLSFSSLNITFSLLLGAIVTGGRPSEEWCKDNSQGYEQRDGLSLCVYQGIWLVFFALSLCCWWFCSCFDLFSKLVLGKRNIEHYLRYYHIFSWGIPLLNTVALLIAGKFGFLAPRVWCFLGSDSYLSEWLGFYAWVLVLWLGGCICMFAVIAYLLKQISKVEGGSSSPTKYFRYLFLYRTPLIFVFSFSIVWAIFVSFRLLVLVNEDSYEESAESWVLCLLLNFAAGVIDPARNASADTSMIIGEPADITEAGCGVVQPNRVSQGLLGLSVFTLSASSIILFLIFGLHRENYRLWRDTICPKPKRKDTFETSISPTKGAALETIQSTSDHGRSFTEVSRTQTPMSSFTEAAAQRATEAKSTCETMYRSCIARITGREMGNANANAQRDPRYQFAMGSSPPPRVKAYDVNENNGVQDVANMSYAEWESQFLRDPLWGIN